MNYRDFVQARKNYLGASDAPIVMGVSPWRTPYQLWQDKLGIGGEQPDNYAMRKGREKEECARDAYIHLTGVKVEPKQVFHPKIKFMMANLDGLSSDSKVAVEIKCPGEEDHSKAKRGEVPEKYFPQLQHQLAVSGLDGMHYFSWRNDDIALVEIEKDADYIKKMCAKEKKFWKHVEDLIPPEYEERDYHKINNDQWNSVAKEFLEAKRDLSWAKEREDMFKKQLIDMAQEKNCRGGGIMLKKIMKKGNIDYGKIPELKDVDLENFRKTPSSYWRIFEDMIDC